MISSLTNFISRSVNNLKNQLNLFKVVLKRFFTHFSSKFEKEIKILLIRKYKFKIFSLAFSVIFLTLPSTHNRIDFLNLTQEKTITRALETNSFTPTKYPELIESDPTPNVSAESVVILEPKSFKILYAKNPQNKLYPASLTKLATALTALSYYSLDEVITVPAINVEGVVMGLREGEKIKVKDLLFGLLIKSANDAAIALSNNQKINPDQFIYSINETVLSLNMKSTHFNNSTGLDDTEHYTTAHDVALLGAQVANNPIISEIVKIKKAIVTDIGKKYWHELENVNSLLGERGVEGIKTGWTEKAGQCFLSYSKKDGKTLISVVLNSQDRFGETRLLLDWAYRVYRW